MTNDNFWKKFWILSSSAILLCTVLSAGLFFAHIGGIDAAAVGVNYVQGKDPFQIGARQAAAVVTINGGYLYRESLPLGVTSWIWNTVLTTRSKTQRSEGTYSLKAVFGKEWAGFGLSGFTVDSRVHKTLSLSVHPDDKVGDIYIELYDKKGNSMGRQSLGWYTASSTLEGNHWQTILIPIENLSAPGATITAISITTTNPGTAYIDALQFNNKDSAHEKWVYIVPSGPAESAPVYVPPPFNPFATSTQVALPYTLTARSSTWDDRWYAFRGYFSQDYDAWRVGPKVGEEDGLTVFRGGLAWGDYQVTSQISWGTAAVIALVARMQDENNYVSCSYTGQGDYIQMYVVKDGVSTYVMESEKQHFYSYNGGVGQLGLIVKGNTLICTMDGKQIISKQLPDMAPRGTIGFESWDRNDKNGPHTIETLKVTQLVGE